MTRATASDPVLGAIIQRLITNAAREMGITLLRSTRSPVLFEARDFATGIFDAEGRVLEQHQYLPLMAFCLGPVVDAVRDRAGDLKPGDVFLHNDAYTGGTHAMDVSVVRPIFSTEAELIGWSACKGHMLDWGGPVPSGYNSQATTRWDEPLRVPALRLYRGGARNEEIHELLAANIRMPEIVLHDVEAMVGATAIGERRILELVGRLGVAAYRRFAQQWIAGTRGRMRTFIASLPSGRYEGRSEVHIDEHRRAEIALAVTISADRMVVDFEGSSAQTESFVNAPMAVTRGGVLQCAAMMLSGSIDLNAGFSEAIDVRAPVGTIVNAVYPAPVGYCLHLTDQISEAFFRALSDVCPDRVVAGWFQWGTTVSGRYRDTEFTTPLFFASKGGGGATHGADGYDYIGSIRMSGALEAEDVETFELVHRWATIRRLGYWPDSAGSGRWRGGLGSYVEVELTGEDMEIATFGTGRDDGAAGLSGGLASPAGRLLLEYPDGQVIDVPAHANIRGVPKGAVLRKWNTGGGGFGPPELRDPELVARDEVEGYTAGSAPRIEAPPYRKHAITKREAPAGRRRPS